MKVAVRDKVRFGETDLMGIVYHANYIPWLEMGRIAYLKSQGVDLTDMMEEGIMPPMLEVNVRYKSTGKFGDAYEVQTEISELNKAKVRFSYKVYKLEKKISADGETEEVPGTLLLEGNTLTAFTNKENHIIRLPEKWYKKFRAAADNPSDELILYEGGL